MAAALLLAGLSMPVQAQLSREDIESLRERGRAEGWTFTVGENDATIYPLKSICGAVEPRDWRSQGRWDDSMPQRDLPSSFNWCSLGGCGPIRNQFSCGSCWAFAAIGSVECYYLIAHGLNLDLSEQWLVSCTSSGTCSGGWHSAAYEYLRCDGQQDPCGGNGVVMESAFPYVAWDMACGCPYPHPYCIPPWYFIGPDWGIPTVDQIKQAVYNHGPVSACVTVNSAFQSYGGGVFNACTDEDINHVVVIVGWDDSQGTNGIWIIRNSWGNWGEDGYMRIEYGCSRIGYASCYLDYVAEAGSTTLPFSDAFPSTSIDRGKWSGVTGAEVSDLGLNPPSPPYSLNLNGSPDGGDSIRTSVMDTTNFADIVLAFQWERTGGGDQPEAGDDLIVEYCDANENWVEITRYPGSGPAMTSFSPASITLLRNDWPSAFHSRLRVQLRVASTETGADDYFVDDVSITTTTDQQPPADLHWVQQPTTISTTAISMSAHADDPSGVDYYFYATGAGSHSSGWQSSPTYTDTPLQVNRSYSYKVKARDHATPIQNETPYTATVSLATFIQTPTALTFDTVTDASVQVTAPGTFTRLNQNLSGLYFEVTAVDGTPVGGSQTNTWTQLSLSQTAAAVGLSPGTAYRFRVKARNYYGVETPWYPASGYIDQATTGGVACSLLGDMNQDGVLNGRDIDGFVRAKLGAAPFTGENQACADFGGTLQQDVTAFVNDLLGP
ncbi:MAG TPA: C1 family peptidase [Phycisphaerae bacterium]|nr:C1 family peptidase [Phycisphaerae bacterium]